MRDAPEAGPADQVHASRRFCARWRSSRWAATRCFAGAKQRVAGAKQREIEGSWVLFLVGILSVALGVAAAFLPGVELLSLSLRRERG